MGVADLETVERVMIPADAVELPDEDGTGRVQFAVPVEVELGADRVGTWDRLKDGSRRWRLRIRSEGAQTLNLALDVFDLPAGAQFWLYDAAASTVQGPYDTSDRNRDGGLWTPVVPGPEVVLDLHVPKDAAYEPRVHVSRVNHGFRGFGNDSASPDKSRRR